MFNILLNVICCLVHQCDISGCKKNLVLDGNFDNNQECCMAEGSGFIEYDSLPDEIKTGCTNTPKLSTRFCEEHLVDHQELDKVCTLYCIYF